MKTFLKWFFVGFLLRMMPAAPSVGTDVNVWGTELNNFLGVAHDLTTGALLDAAVGKINSINSQTGNYTLTNADGGRLVTITAAASNSVTIPTDAAMSGGALPIGQMIMVRQGGAGQTAIVAASGVTMRARGGFTALNGQYAYVTLIKIAANTWEIFGDTA